MNTLTLALAQINTTVGALEENASKILNCTQAAISEGAQVIVFPELALSGYPPEDLILKPHFIDDTQRVLRNLAKHLPHQCLCILGCPRKKEEKVYNSAIFLHRGQEIGEYRKILLPNYGVFDEKRVFDPGQKATVLSLGPFQLGIHICEDSWFLDKSPCIDFKEGELDAIINLSSSPYHSTKHATREAALSALALKFKTYVFYCNLIGGQDELVFDGQSLVVSPTSTIIARGKSFEEDIMLFTIKQTTENALVKRERSSTIHYIECDSTAFYKLQTEACQTTKNQNKSFSLPPPHQAFVEETLMEEEEIYRALCLGLKDYVEKNKFTQTLVALSGGIDSALVATLAVDTFGSDSVNALTMPSMYSSPETRRDAKHLAHNLNINLMELSIESIFENYIDLLTPLWDPKQPDHTEENLQARIRGNLVMALSNKLGWLVLTTGNKSELATGYCTLYGDMAGGFAVIKDVPKTLVIRLVKWRNASEDNATIPPTIISRPPSAELSLNQKDSDSLPPYEILDPILERIIELDKSAAEIISEGFDSSLVHNIMRLVDLNEYKRRQGAPGIKITPKSFGRDRRLPITNAYREHR